MMTQAQDRVIEMDDMFLATILCRSVVTVCDPAKATVLAGIATNYD